MSPLFARGAQDVQARRRAEATRSRWLLGLVIVILLAVGSFLAYTKRVPFSDRGYELHATFENIATLRPASPVRIAGVNVGEVTGVEAKGEAVDVTFTVDDQGRPIHDDAAVEIRPRLFLEGNFFLDLRPGSPSAAELPDGGAIPAAQTSTAVQLDEVLTALQSDSRENLQELLEGYGTALTYEPTPADDATQDPDTRGETAAESVNDSFAYGGRAGKGTAIVSDALLGQNEHDLSRMIEAQRDTFAKLTGREAELQGLITNFNITAGALATESANVSASIRELAPTLEQAEPSLRHLSEALPPVRAWARVLEPNIRALPGTIRAAGPWLDQAKLLLRKRELGRLADLLGDAAPDLAGTADASLELFPEVTALSRCASEVLEPTGNIVVDDDFSTGEPNFNELFYSTVNLAGESQSFDGNGQYLQLQTGGGGTLVQSPNPDGASEPQNTKVFGNALEPFAGVQPALPPTGQPPIRADVPCHTNAIPDVNGPLGQVAPADLTPVP